MANLKLVDIRDGDQGPVAVMELHDENGAVLDSSMVAVELRLTQSDGTLLRTIPGVAQSPRSAGLIRFYLGGRETDWLGLGHTILAHPKIYIALAPDRTIATQLLLTPSFDVDTNADGIADNWTRSGSGPAHVLTVTDDDVAPPTIYAGGKRQSSLHTAGGDTDFLTQSASVTLAAGDYISAGVWHRATLLAGLNGGANYYLMIPALGGIADQKTNFTDGDVNWNFIRVQGRVMSAASSASIKLATYSAINYRVCFDDAFLFKGQWSVETPDYFEIPVRPRPRKVKTQTHEMTDGVGSFEVDSDGDGLADGWANFASGATFTLDGAEFNTGFGSEKSQKITLVGAAGKFLRLIVRDKFLTSETWEFRVYYKTNGALTGSPGAGTFAPAISTQNFDGANEAAAGTNFNTNQASWASSTATITLSADHGSLVCDVNLGNVTGSMWIDDVQLKRLSPP